MNKENLKGIVLVTGVSMTPATVQFVEPEPATLVRSETSCFKMNAAAGTAAVLSQNNWFVYAVGYSEKTLGLLAQEQMRQPFQLRGADLKDTIDTRTIAKELMALKKATGLPVHLVHYGGASETKTPLPNGSVFGTPWVIAAGAFPDLVANNCTTLINILQACKEEGVFEDQKVTKVVFITAITALRTKLEHSLDAAQKGAGHALARSLALDLTPERIYITEVMPGITDTGFYDNQQTFDSIVRASAAFGYHYDRKNFPVFSAERVGQTVQFALEFSGYVREVSVMPYGQYPHLGA